MTHTSTDQELIQALKDHRLPHDKPSQIADSFRHGWQAARRAPAVPQGWKLVQIELLERIQESLGSFLSDQGWSQSDMDTADALDGLLASTPHLPAQPGWCDGCSPDNCCGCGPSQAGEQL